MVFCVSPNFPDWLFSFESSPPKQIILAWALFYGADLLLSDSQLVVGRLHRISRRIFLKLGVWMGPSYPRTFKGRLFVRDGDGSPIIFPPPCVPTRLMILLKNIEGFLECAVMGTFLLKSSRPGEPRLCECF
jgi:hypothetical protein